MHSWRNFVDKAKRYWPLEGFEKRGLVISLIILSLIFFLHFFGETEIDWGFGIRKFLLTLLFVAIAFLIRELAIRTIATWLGYRAQYKAWILGLVVGIIIIFVSYGKLIFLAAGTLVITHLPIHRLGKGYYELNMKHLGWIAMASPIANMLFAIILKSLSVWTGLAFFEKAMMINIWIALFDMVPIPPFNGSRTFFGSRYVYIFVLGALIGCAVLLKRMTGILPILGAIVLGALMLLIFFIYVDKKW